LRDLLYISKNNEPEESNCSTSLKRSSGFRFRGDKSVFKEGEKEHLVIKTADISCETPIVRVHSECLTGDALGSLRCDCRDQLGIALDAIDKNGCGMVIYLRQEGRGIGLLNKVNAYKLQDEGLNTYEANHQLGFASDERNFEIVEYILSYYGIKKIKLLTNNPKKQESIKGVEIVERLPVIAEKHELNKNYLKAKQEFGHLL
jgi:GTP cyclohydrolase II